MVKHTTTCKIWIKHCADIPIEQCGLAHIEQCAQLLFFVFPSMCQTKSKWKISINQYAQKHTEQCAQICWEHCAQRHRFAHFAIYIILCIVVQTSSGVLQF